MNKIIQIAISFILLIGALTVQESFAQNVKEMDRRAQRYFEKKDFGKAIALLINILDIDPGNTSIQKKVEIIYELKQKKDLALEKARLNYKIARKTLFINQISDNLDVDDPRKLDIEKIQRNVKYIVNKADIAISSFIIAYRIDPRDPDIQLLKEDMERLERDVKAEQDKERLSLALKRRYRRLKALAIKEMDLEKYPIALKHWEEILTFFSKDPEALEGRRKCKLAIENRIKFEKIQYFMKRGVAFFSKKQFKIARLEFVQALNLDKRNREAKRYIEQIDEKLEEIRFYEQRKLQAEDFYKSGIANLRNNKFELASEDFESAIALIENYKDAKNKLLSIEKLRKAFENRARLQKLAKINREFQKGMIALSQTRFKQAIASFTTTLSLDPANKLAKQYLDRARDAQGQIEEERVDRNSPYYNIVQSLIVSGRNYYRKGNYKESRKQWDKILKLFPKNRVASEYLIRCDLKLNPGAYETFASQMVAEGKANLAKKNYRDALRNFELLKSVSNRYPGINRLIAQARAGLNTSGVNLSGTEKRTVSQRYRNALALYQQGSRQSRLRALSELRWVVQKDPGNVKAAISINKIESELRIGSGKTRVARRRLSAKQLRLVNKYYYAGISHYSNNNFKRAIQEWRKVLAIDPGNVKAKNNIRKCLVFLGR